MSPLALDLVSCHKIKISSPADLVLWVKIFPPCVTGTYNSSLTLATTLMVILALYFYNYRTLNLQPNFMGRTNFAVTDRYELYPHIKIPRLNLNTEYR